MIAASELKQFAEVHCRSQGITDHAGVLDRIRHNEDGTEGSWVREWTASAAGHEDAGRLEQACAHYNMARFPYVDGAARHQALDGCVRTFTGWAQRQACYERLELDLPEGRVHAWASGLSAKRRRPLLVIMGGIVSVKEQWAPVLKGINRLGMAGVVTEMPGVGQNEQVYTPDSWRMLPAVLDRVADRADTGRTYLMAMSFSGHLALRAAMEDSRIKGIVTTGAPVHEFFTDVAWQRSVPRITMDTLAHLTGIDPDKVVGGMAAWALPDEGLRDLGIPVDYVVSNRDEIIPRGDVARLGARLSALRLLFHDDVHGAPAHVAYTRLWTARSLVRMRGGMPLQHAVMGGLLKLVAVREKRRMLQAKAA
jgi:pimeloyl-ACP methyl ester carboxylesterase